MPQSTRDIANYGASIERANVPPGTAYWKVVKAYHLTGAENGGNHNIYADVLRADGTRWYGAQVRQLWPGGDALAVVEKPPEEPGTNVPMWISGVYGIEAVGMPSDRVVGLHTKHPDEESGNTTGHHSFMVVFQETVATGGAPPAPPPGPAPTPPPPVMPPPTTGADVAALRQQLAAMTAERDRLWNALAQIKQVISGLGI